jgi:hypothetical protein
MEMGEMAFLDSQTAKIKYLAPMPVGRLSHGSI